MEDRCIHRAYPLSAGRREGDRVVCGYHGFTYDFDGCLVDVPSQENVPPGARVRTYPVHEQSPFVWMWLGDPGAAALRPPPRLPWYADGTGWRALPRCCASRRTTCCFTSTTSTSPMSS